MANEIEILFGGYGPLPPKLPEFKKPEGRPKWVEVLEEAFIKLTSTDEGKQLYGDPQKGATLEQAWRTSGIFTGKWPVCLISTEKPAVPTSEIKHVIKMSSKQFVDTLTELFEMYTTRMAVQVLYHDDYMGHSVALLRYDNETSRFTYHDPWPGDSLLCRDFNAAGIDAQKNESGWSVTAAELEKVIFAAFVFSPNWSEYIGEKYYNTYDELKTTDFWKFFHLSEIETQKLDGDRTLVRLQTGGFQSEIELHVSLNQKGRLVEGVLSLRRSWVTGPPYGLNPFSLDIARSFIAALTPPMDQEVVSGLINMLRQIQNPTYAEQMINERANKSILHRALFTYLGPSPSVEATSDYSTFAMSNVKHEDADWLEIKITTDAL